MAGIGRVQMTTSAMSFSSMPIHRWSRPSGYAFVKYKPHRTRASATEGAAGVTGVKTDSASVQKQIPRVAGPVEVHEVDSSGESIQRYARVGGTWTSTDGQRSGTSFKITERIKGALLPEGFPNSVTPDYLDYQLWALPTHITGWLASSLVTSTLLKAVGIGATPTAAAAAGAAIKWITKDGIGALGRFLVGSSLGRYMDEDPRFWRMVAAGIHICGASLEIVTARNPSAFVVLATSGNLAKAVSKGIGRPSFRVVQNHFAAGQNVGDVAAKEEIWEVCGQLTGLACSVALLNALALIPDPSGEHIIGVWLAIQLSNIFLRYKALSMLQLPWLSQRRAVMLATAFVKGEELPTVKSLCSSESFAVPKQLQRPGLLMNASVEQLSRAAVALEVARGTFGGKRLLGAGNGTQAQPLQARKASDAASTNGSLPASRIADPAASALSQSPGTMLAGRNEQNVSNGIGALHERCTSNGTAGVADSSHNGSGASGLRPSELVQFRDDSTSTSAADAPARNNTERAEDRMQQDDFSGLLALYGDDSYVLIPSAQFIKGLGRSAPLLSRASQEMLVGVKKGATPAALLQAVLQAAWLHAALEDCAAAGQQDSRDTSQWREDAAGLLVQSLEFARSHNDAFLSAMRLQGWDVDDVRMRSGQAGMLSLVYADV